MKAPLSWKNADDVVCNISYKLAEEDFLEMSDFIAYLVHYSPISQEEVENLLVGFYHHMQVKKVCREITDNLGGDSHATI